MKRVVRLALLLVVAIVFCQCEKSFPGSIYGVVVNKATGEPLQSAGVELLPLGKKTVTGSEGQFEFSDIEEGEYTIRVTKTGYIDINGYKVIVNSGKSTRCDIQIEQEPSALRIVDGAGKDITTLDFGAESDVTSRTFSIFNDSPNSLTWWIESNCSWISECKSVFSGEQQGRLEASKQEPIRIVVNRENLGYGLKSTIINISSDDGSAELLVTIGEEVAIPEVETKPVTNATYSSATLNGLIKKEGAPKYSERGFVYDINPQPTIDGNMGKLNASVNSQLSYDALLCDLTVGTIYYIRAYALNPIGVAYGNEITYKPIIQTELSTVDVTDFQINSTNITAKLSCKILVEGTPKYDEVGICAATKTNPTIDDLKFVAREGDITSNKITLNGTFTGYSTKYYVRAYAKQDGKVFYFEETNFRTPQHPDIYILEEKNLMVQKIDLGVAYWTAAKIMCENSTIGGFTDWRLPTIEELMSLYNKREEIGGFTTKYGYDSNNTAYLHKYWSSTEKNTSSYHYVVDFTNGSVYSIINGDYRHSVRAVRSIK